MNPMNITKLWARIKWIALVTLVWFVATAAIHFVVGVTTDTDPWGFGVSGCIAMFLMICLAGWRE